ncbi:MAG: sulfatase-like hydrolase/transferase [Acidimicrobiales bacterium]|nr:sulfatase-like hydrolase/transferase [Acidimicrobiales bacterium]
MTGVADGAPPRSSRVARLPRNGLELLALTGLAVAQPLLDLFGKNPEFFVAKDAGARDVVVFGVAVTFVLPAVLLGVEALAFLVRPGLGRAVHSTFVGVLGAAFGLIVLRQTGLDAPVVVLGLALAAGVALALAQRRWHSARFGLRVLAFAPLLFLGVFLVFSSTARLIWEPEAEVATNVEVGRAAPVVVLVLDEFPLASILAPDGSVNAERFPGFARLAASSSWFRDASSYSWQTEHSVPSILTGEEPRANEIATSIDHPRNLFTLLGGSYELNVDEEITSLCPSSVCETGSDARDTPSASLRGSLLDAAVVYGHATLPSVLRAHLPSIAHSWGDFVAPVDDGSPAERVDAAAVPATSRGGDRDAEELANFARWAERGVAGQAPPAQGAIVEGLVDSAATPGDARLSFAHVVLPHYPWQMTPSGRRYTSRSDLASYTERGTWDDDEWAVRQAQQQHLLQVGYVDGLVARLQDRMQDAGTWDEALVVVVADHGVSFRPGGPQRQPTDANLDEIYRVPLFVKAPGQSTGEVRDDNARLIDVLPTMVDALDLDTDWEFDGRSLYDDDAAPRDKEVFGDEERTTIPTGIGGLLDVVELNERRFGRDEGWRGVFAVGSRGDAVGTRVADLPTTDDTGIRWSIDQQDAFASVDPASGFVPLLVSGRLEGPTGTTLPDAVLIAVNGTVAGVGGGFRVAGETTTFDALLAESTLRPGANELTVLVPSGTGSATTYAVAEPVDRPTFALRRGRLVPAGTDDAGRALAEPSDDLALEVESAFDDGQTLALKGWAADRDADAIADLVLVFADGEQVGVAARRERPDLVDELGDGLLQAGFEAVVAAEQVPEGARIDVVAVFGDRAVRTRVRPDR